jgi:enoyl-CoA hydratase
MDRHDSEFLHVEDAGQVRRITVDRPKVRNALNDQVMRALCRALEETPEETRVVVLQGAGDKAFIAGADIAAMNAMGPDAALHWARLGQRVTRAIESRPQLTVARVQGFALGGGCEMAMACDLIVASRNAKFGQPEVTLGLIPGFGGSQRLVQRVGLSAALDMLCTGRMVGAEEAFRMGLVSRLVDEDALDTEIDAIVGAIRKTGPRAVAEVKRLARQAMSCNLETGLDLEASAFGTCFDRQEAREGMGAFLEKRPARF